MADEAVTQMRVCSKCRCEKPLDEFVANKLSKLGRERRCKACSYVRAKELREANREAAKATRAKWYAQHGIKNRRDWAARNPEKVKAAKARHSAKHSAAIIERVRKWRKENPEKRRAESRRTAARLRATPKGKLNNAFSTAVRQALVNGKLGRGWVDIVGYSIDELMAHLETKFLPGMSWDNYGAWHIDHIIPQAAFNYSDASHIDFARCWALKNLQPLWAKDNASKGAKLSEPFQPSLAI